MIFTKQQEKEWALIPQSPNYISVCGNYIAVYKYTHRSGYAAYWVFRAYSTPKARLLKNALSVGGLPSLVSIK